MIGSLQVTIPAGCMNDCPFCVYRQHATRFRTEWQSNHERWTQEIAKRVRYAASRVAAIMITSHGEPTININYIRDVMGIINRVAPEMAHVEIQTSGVGLTEEKLDILYEAGIRVISLSVPALHEEDIIRIMRVPAKANYEPLNLVAMIREKGFVLRLSIAMTNWFDDYNIDYIMDLLVNVWKPSQASFKKLYGADNIATKVYDELLTEFKSRTRYRKLELLALGAWKYDADGIGVVWNDDCMVSEETADPRYLILQPDAKLYTRWDTKGSVIF
ncbi:MAG: putative Radical SAM domain protein [Candidatus Thorarchaeota archaeon]|nr:MAG: putative Radical SAM domain protein [Candidatus Thorarchaeota archaeon]